MCRFFVLETAPHNPQSHNFDWTAARHLQLYSHRRIANSDTEPFEPPTMSASPPIHDFLDDDSLAPLKRNHACLQCKKRKVKCDGVSLAAFAGPVAELTSRPNPPVHRACVPTLTHCERHRGTRRRRRCSHARGRRTRATPTRILQRLHSKPCRKPSLGRDRLYQELERAGRSRVNRRGPKGPW